MQEVLPQRIAPAKRFELGVNQSQLSVVLIVLGFADAGITRAVDDCSQNEVFLSLAQPPLDCPFHVVPFQLVACATRSLPALVQTSRHTRRRAPLFEGNPTSLGGCASF